MPAYPPGPATLDPIETVSADERRALGSARRGADPHGRGPRTVRPGPEIAGTVQSGQIGNVIARLPAPARQVAGTITRAAFTTGLDRILLVAAIIAFAAGAVSLAAIRSRDFARAAPGGQESPGK
jgi:hypothetical protein